VINGLSLRRRRNLGQILTDSLGVYRTTLIARLLVLALPGVLLGIVTVWAATSLPFPASDLIVFVVWFLEAALIGSSAIYALDQWNRGVGASVKDCFLKAWYHVPDLLAATAISIAVIVGLCITVIGIPWAVARYVRWVFASQVIMIENTDGKPALGRSADLVFGRGWQTFLALIVIELVVAGPLFALSEITSRNFDGLPQWSVGITIVALTFPFRVTARTLLYYDLKMRKALA
jgi:hypothetical protein